MNDSKKRVNILGTDIDKVTEEELIDKVISALDLSHKLFIATANPEGVMLALKDENFRKAVNGADIITADGTGILWAATVLNLKTSKTFFRFLEIPFLALIYLFLLIFHSSSVRKILPERISGSDLFWEIVRKAFEKDKSIFLLGGEEGVAEKVKQKLERKFSKIKIAGFYPGFPGERGLTERINSAKPDILFVAWGQPKQEKWIYENLGNLNVRVIIGVGGTFDFVSGKIKRAPKFLRKIDLEWLWRLFKEPKRGKRIFAAVPKFIYAIIKEKLKYKK